MVMSVNFDGTNDYAEISDNAALDVGANTPFMIGIMVRPETYHADWRHIISKWDESGNFGWALRWMSDGSGKGKFEFRIDSGGEYAVESGDGFDKDIWHWLVVGRTKVSTTYRLYITTGISTTIYASASGGSLSNSVPIRMGARSWGSASEYFDGQIGRVVFAKDIAEGIPSGNPDWDRLKGYPPSAGGGNLIRTIYRPQYGKTQLYLNCNEVDKTTVYDKANGFSCMLYNGASIIHKVYASQTVYPKWFD
jgi:hypothetical protein